jgi:DNA polymerase-3 subunit delta'
MGQLIGHAGVCERLEADFQQQKLAHAYLICGPKGIGKATLAKQFAAHILSAEDEQGRERIRSGAHAGLKTIQRAADSKTGELRRDIVIEQAREIGHFFAMTTGEGAYRVVIIDSIDEMNANATNAILKNLEEPPPHSLFLLISHHPGKLLPTIRSRCQLLKCSPLSHAEYLRIMTRELPDVAEETILKLGEICDGSPATAIEYYAQGAHVFYDQLAAFFDGLPDVSPADVLAISKWMGSGNTAKAKWPLFSVMILQLIAERAKNQKSLADAHFWAEKWAETQDAFTATEKLSLDYSAVIISFLHSLATKQPFALTA